MPESQSKLYRRMMLQADSSIFNAISYLYGYYCVLMRADPILAAALEKAIGDLDDTRETIHQVHVLAWDSDDEQFTSIGEAHKLILDARNEIFRKGRLCRAYSQLWDPSVAASSRLLGRRAAALRRRSDSHPSKLEE